MIVPGGGRIRRCGCAGRELGRACQSKAGLTERGPGGVVRRGAMQAFLICALSDLGA